MTANQNGDDFSAVIRKAIEKYFDEEGLRSKPEPIPVLTKPEPIFEPGIFKPLEMEGLKPGELYIFSSPVKVGPFPIHSINFNITVNIPKKCPECGCEFYKSHPDGECQYGLVQQVIDE